MIDIDPLAGELGYVREQDGEIRIGAMTRHRDLLESDLLARRLAIFTDAERVIADPVVRNRGTIGGALCQADPSEDLSAVCAAVGAQDGDPGLAAASASIGMREFHRGPYETAVGPAEMLVEIRVPLRERRRQRVREGRPARRATGPSSPRARRSRSRRRDDRARRHRAGRGGGDITSLDAEASLAGEAPSDEAFARAASLAAAACRPVSDQRGSAEYKRHVAGVLTERVLRRATARALGEEA